MEQVPSHRQAGSSRREQSSRQRPAPDGELPGPTAGRAAARVDRGGQSVAWEVEEVATEYPLTLLVNGREMATIVCSPTHLEELALGFLTAEGVLRPGEPLSEFFLDRRGGVLVVKAPDREGALEQDGFGKRWVGSCCGKSRTGFYMANDVRTARRVESDLELTTGDCFRLMRALQRSSPLFSRTGGVHHAALATAEGLQVVRADIGRHNTLDKLYGWALREERGTEHRVVVFSGRISSEVLLKVSKMGCPVILSKSAPTALALELADDLGITAVGFLREGRMNAYSHTARITDLPRGPRSHAGSPR